MKLKNLVITLFILSNFYIDSRSQVADMPFTQIRDLIFSEKNDTSLTEFGIAVATVDVNGDLFDDLFISELKAGIVYIYLGGEEIDSIPDLILHTEQTGSNFGITVSDAGDINNDGINDIMVGASHYCIANLDYRGRVYIYYGGIKMDNIPDLVFQGSINSAFLGTDIAKLSDVNSDGCDDIGMCESNNDTCYIYFGGADVDTIPDLRICINDDGYSHSISTGGDFNDDSGLDILISSPYYGELYDWSNPMYPIYYPPYGRTYLFYGGESLDAISDMVFEGQEHGDKLGCQLPNSIGDINNDSIDDIIIGATDHVEIFYGGNQSDNIPDVSLPYINNRNGISYIGDINNDSIGDIVLITQENSMSERYAYIYFGGENFDDISDKQITFHSLTENWGVSVFDGVDINSDNSNDLIFTYRNEANGEVQVYFGGELLDTIPDLRYNGLKLDGSYGTSISSAGDINNDGYDDIVIGAPEYSINKGRAYIYFGGPALDTVADFILEGNDVNNAFGKYVSGIGDINNDGYDDILISSSNSLIFNGGETLESTPGIILSHDIYKSYKPGGDINNDDYDDIIASNGEQIAVLFGGIAMDSIPDFEIHLQHNNYNYAGDINNDGYDDIIVSNSKYGSNIGRVYIYYGGAILNDSVDVVITGQGSKDYFGRELSSLGDVNNDNYDDVIISGSDNCRIFFGGDIFDTIPGVTLDIIYDDSYYHNLPCMLTHAKDINGNGIDDVVVIARDYPMVSARNDKYLAYVFYGDENIDSQADTIIIFNPQPVNNISSAGDVNGDSGYDLIIGSGLYPSLNKTVHLIFGNDLIKINEHPLSVLACNNDTTVFSVSATNVLKYSWEMSSDSGLTYTELEDNDYYSGSETSFLQAIARVDISENCFRCKLYNEERYRYTDPAYLTVNSRPTATFLGDSLYCLEDSAKLSIEFFGTNPWYYTLSDGSNSEEFISYVNYHTFMVDNPGVYSIISLLDRNCVGLNIYDEVVVEECTSFSDLENILINIYPNPTGGNLMIDNLPDNAELQVLSTTGQTLLLSSVNTGKIEIDLSSYKPGICFLKIIMPGRILVSKIVIE